VQLIERPAELAGQRHQRRQPFLTQFLELLLAGLPAFRETLLVACFAALRKSGFITFLLCRRAGLLTQGAQFRLLLEAALTFALLGVVRRRRAGAGLLPQLVHVPAAPGGERLAE